MKINDARMSTDGSIKYRLAVPNKGIIETIYFNFDGHYGKLESNSKVLCLSSQVGCSMGCSFCETGKLSKSVNLSGLEMYNQVNLVQKDVSSRGLSRANFYAIMGMGEPLANLENVLQFYSLARPTVNRISLSTLGIATVINQLAERSEDFELFISLHSPFDSEREKLIPLNKVWPIKKVLDSGKEYSVSRNEKVNLSYMVMPHTNDTSDHFKELIALVDPNCFSVQLTCFNSNNYAETLIARNYFSNEVIPRFIKFMNLAKIEYDVQVSKGIDIFGGCGQLSNSNKGAEEIC